MRQMTRAFAIWGIISLLLLSAGCEIIQTQYTLKVSVNGSGSVSPSGGTYDEDTTVTLTAEADSGWEFTGWSGDVSGTNATIQVVMDSDKTVAANFSRTTQQQFSLTVTTSGNGSVNSWGGTYDQGVTVSLTAEADSGWEFTGWSGDVSGTSATIQVVMNSDKTVTANFTETTVNEIELEFQAEETSLYNSVVESEHSGYTGSGYVNFANQTGSSMAWTIQAAASGNVELTFRFANGSSATRPMDIVVNGSTQVSGLGFVQTGAWTSWAEITTTVYLNSGTNELEAVSAGSQGGPNMDVVYVLGNFEEIPDYTLTIYTNGSGAVSPSGGDYSQGTTVTLTATPSSGWAFQSWSGDVSGTSTRIQVVMDSDKAVTANFSATSSEPEEFEAIYNSEASGSYTDSNHFRVYNAGSSSNLMLAHLEAAYKCFVTDWGFRSTGLSVFDSENNGPYYKMNVISDSIDAGGYMGYDSGEGLAYLLINSGYVTQPRIFVHEFGHALTLHSINWMDQARTGAWWETVANWVADTYLNSSYYDTVRQSYGLGEGGTIIELDVVIGNSYMTIVNDQNYYQAWPFLTYLTNNPDNYPGLGRMAVPDLFRNHTRNNETPLHVLEKISSQASVQTILGRYWARMAYLDIGHERAQQAFFNQRNSLDFANLDSYGGGVFRVKSNRRPMYGGANIIPLSVTGNGSVSIDVTNLGNGLSESNFTATLSIRSSSGSVRYVNLPGGYGSATVGSYEEASLVVVNTPDTLYQYDAFSTTSSDPEAVGLNYEVEITGAVPAD